MENIMLFSKSAQLLDHAALLYVLMTTNDMNSSNVNYTVVCVADFLLSSILVKSIYF